MHSKKVYKYIEPIPSFYHNSIYQLEISKSTISNAGLGTFTKENIPINTFIDFYSGDLFSIPTSKYYFSIDDTIGIDAGLYPRCYMAMINDGFTKNNCEFKVDKKDKIISVWTTRHINAEEELFASYGEEYWKN